MDNIRVEPDSSSPAIAKKPVGRPRILTAEHLKVLAELARETPVSSRWDIARAFKRRTGLTVSPDTLRKALRAQGFVRQERGAPAAAENTAESGSSPGAVQAETSSQGTERTAATAPVAATSAEPGNRRPTPAEGW